MRAIVTGSAGFIGSHLVKRLESDVWDVTGIDRKTGPSIEGYPDLPTDVDAIWHLAAPVGPLGVLAQAGTIVYQMVETSAIVAQWALAYDCPLINVSTSEVYGSGHADKEEDPCTFQPAQSARKEYAIGKLAVETMLHNTAGLDVRTIRPFNVAGPGQLSEGGFVLPRFIEQARSGQPLTVYQPGSQQRAFTHVYDIVDGLVAAYTWGKAGEVYNLGNARNQCSIYQLAHEVISAVGQGSVSFVDPKDIHGPDFREAPDKIPNADKARDELHWFPVRTRADIIADALA